MNLLFKKLLSFYIWFGNILIYIPLTHSLNNTQPNIKLMDTDTDFLQNCLYNKKIAYVPMLHHVDDFFKKHGSQASRTISLTLENLEIQNNNTQNLTENLNKLKNFLNSIFDHIKIELTNLRGNYIIDIQQVNNCFIFNKTTPHSPDFIIFIKILCSLINFLQNNKKKQDVLMDNNYILQLERKNKNVLIYLDQQNNNKLTNLPQKLILENLPPLTFFLPHINNLKDPTAFFNTILNLKKFTQKLNNLKETLKDTLAFLEKINANFKDVFKEDQQILDKQLMFLLVELIYNFTGTLYYLYLALAQANPMDPQDREKLALENYLCALINVILTPMPNLIKTIAGMDFDNFTKLQHNILLNFNTMVTKHKLIYWQLCGINFFRQQIFKTPKLNSLNFNIKKQQLDKITNFALITKNFCNYQNNPLILHIKTLQNLINLLESIGFYKPNLGLLLDFILNLKCNLLVERLGQLREFNNFDSLLNLTFFFTLNKLPKHSSIKIEQLEEDIEKYKQNPTSNKEWLTENNSILNSSTHPLLDKSYSYPTYQLINNFNLQKEPKKVYFNN